MSNRYDLRFKDLTFEDFARLAEDESLTPWEKVGFPDDFRKGKDQAIFEDIVNKIPALNQPGRTVLEIGPGCSPLAHHFIQLASAKQHTLILVDSAPVLAQLPDAPCLQKHAARFPDCPSLLEAYAGKIDVILCYSVLQYVFHSQKVWLFLDTVLSMLDHQGALLLGDLPNSTKRKRFLQSPRGIAYHKEYMNTETMPDIKYGTPEPGQIDDAVILSIILRARMQGFDAYIMPQPEGLPMANRREDILIRRP